MFSLQVNYSRSPELLEIGRCTSCLVGKASDDRGLAAIAFGSSISDQVDVLTYEPSDLSYSLGGTTASIDDLAPLIARFATGSVFCDTTSLGFVETLLCIRALKEGAAREACLVYVEPDDYHNQRTPGVLHRRDFSLSERAQTFTAVPGSVIMVNNQRRTKAVVMVGYEGDRLQQFLEQNSVAGDDCSVIYGVPAFNAGWETNAFANTIAEIDERRISAVLFAGAINPLAAYDAIKDVHAGVSCDGGLMIVPIGTKPHGIGAALYACEHDDVGLVYDHPQKLSGRTVGVGVWNLYRVKK